MVDRNKKRLSPNLKYLSLGQLGCPSLSGVSYLPLYFMTLVRCLSSALERIERLQRILVPKNGGKKKFHPCSGRFFINLMVKVDLGIGQISFGLNTLPGKWFGGLETA